MVMCTRCSTAQFIESRQFEDFCHNCKTVYPNTNRFAIVHEARRHIGLHDWQPGYNNPSDLRSAAYAPPCAPQGQQFLPQSRVSQLVNRDRRNSRVLRNTEVFEHTGRYEDVRTKRDFVAGFLYNDLASRNRFLSGHDVWGNCLEFIYLVFYRLGLLNAQDLTRIAHCNVRMVFVLMDLLKSSAIQKNFVLPGDLVVWFTRGRTELAQDEVWNHIGIISSTNPLQSISLEEQNSDDSSGADINTHVFEAPVEEADADEDESDENWWGIEQIRVPYYVRPSNFLSKLDTLSQDRRYAIPTLPTIPEGALSTPLPDSPTAPAPTHGSWNGAPPSPTLSRSSSVASFVPPSSIRSRSSSVASFVPPEDDTEAWQQYSDAEEETNAAQHSFSQTTRPHNKRSQSVPPQPRMPDPRSIQKKRRGSR